jgi:hypothetical protein
MPTGVSTKIWDGEPMTEAKATFVVQIARTTNYELRVVANDESDAKLIALDLWQTADTIGQWEIPDETADVVGVTKALGGGQS